MQALRFPIPQSSGSVGTALSFEFHAGIGAGIAIPVAPVNDPASDILARYFNIFFLHRPDHFC